MFHKKKTIFRKRSFVVALSTMSSLLLLLTAYQNCGRSLTTLSSADRTNSSLCEGECSSVDGVGDEISGPSDGNEMIVEVPPSGDAPVAHPEDPAPDNGTKTPSENQWIQVAKRTKAQKMAGIAGGEGWQMIFGIAYATAKIERPLIPLDHAEIVWT